MRRALAAASPADFGEAVGVLIANTTLSAAVSLAGATAPPLLWIHPGNVW